MNGNFNLKIGDDVTVIGYKDCRCGYSSDMRRYVGNNAKITQIAFSHDRNCFFYKLDTDKGKWWWDERNLSSKSIQENLPDFESVSLSELVAFLM